MDGPFNLADYVLAAGAACPEKTALSLISPDGAEALSFGALRDAVAGTAGGLLAAGLAPGERVLLRLGNTPDFPIAYLGAIWAGLVPVPTAAVLTEGEVEKMIGAVSPALVLRDPAVSCPAAEMPVIDLYALREMRGHARVPAHLGDAERLAYIVFTSGTSGHAMAVMHAHRAILGRRMMFEGWYGLRSDDRMLHAGAFNWTYTLGTGLMDPWTLGATALIPAPGTSSKMLPSLIARHEATLFAAAPGVFRQMLRAVPGPWNAPKLRHGLSAGEKMADATAQAWRDATGTEVHEAFGMSECSTFISGAPTRPAAAGSLGAPQPGRRVSLRSGGAEVPRETPGTIAVHASDPGLMLGYLNAPDQTAARFDGGWFLTGDLGQSDPEGHITYLGRADDMMNAGGFRVSPLEVEAALLSHPQITGVAAAEVSVGAGSSVIAAFYTAESPISEPSLHDFAREHLARYKQPRAYIHLDALPTSGNGKIARTKLRQYALSTPVAKDVAE